MSLYSEGTNKVTKEGNDATVAALTASVDTKVVEIDAKIAALPDVDAVAAQKAVAMAIVFGG